MNWEDISKEKNLTIEFLQEHQNEIFWTMISRYSQLNKELMETFPKQMFWANVTKNPSFTIEFLEEIKEESFVDWDTISMAYPITKEFYDQFKEYIDPSFLLMNGNKKVEVEKIKKEYTSWNGETVMDVEYVVTEKKEEESNKPTLTLRIEKSRKNTAAVGMEFNFSPGRIEKGWL